MRQIIKIGPDGSMQSLRTPEGRGVDIRQFGRAQIERVSEVVWNEDCQLWFIRFKNGKKLSIENLRHAVEYYKKPMDVMLNECYDSDALFYEYEEAIDAEVFFLNYIAENNLSLGS